MACTVLEAEVAGLRDQLAQTRGSRRNRRAAAPAGEPLMFEGAPVPDVTGVGAATVLAVLRARKQHPGETQKQLAKRVQVSDRTVRLVLAAAPDRDLALAAT